MSFRQTEAQHQRRVILEVLQEDSSYSHNEVILKTALHSIGHNISSDTLNTQLNWLQEQQLVELDEVEGLTIVKLTQRGQDVATGATDVPGVMRGRLK